MDCNDSCSNGVLAVKINIKELETSGFTVHVDSDEIQIHPKRHNEGFHNRVMELCNDMALNEPETDQAFAALHKINIMSAIRKCSNW